MSIPPKKVNTKNYDYKTGWGKTNPERLAAVFANSGTEVIDIGCASGDYVRVLCERGYSARGCDIENRAEWNGDKRFFVADAEALSLPPESVDTALCFEVLEHLSKPFDALRAIRSCCRKNAILSVPNCEPPLVLPQTGLTFNHYIDRSHRNFWSPAEFAALVAEAGFKVREVKPINRVRPEALFLAGFLRLPMSLALRAGSVFAAMPWAKRWHMTTLIVAEK